MRDRIASNQIAVDVGQDLLKTLLSAASFSEDITLQAYENVDHSYLLARTIRSGELNGVETEFAYLENAPGYIFINPSTFISKKVPSKTISQLTGTDWSDHPSLLFSIQTQKKATIAHYGLFAVNSFSSSDALSLLNRFERIDGKMNKQIPFTKKIDELATFLQINWKNTIHSIKEVISAKEGKVLPLPSEKDLKKTFYKPFSLYFHDKSDYSSLIFSFDNFITHLEQSNIMDNPSVNISLNPHPLASLLNKSLEKTDSKKMLLNELSTEQDNLSEIDKNNKLKGLFFRAQGSLSKSSRKKMESEEFDGKSVYERYCDYLDTGARHNELASRIYPWEITGIEWGGSDACKINAVANTIITIERKKKLFQELEEQKFKHPLFIDFMLNKLSIENPEWSYDEVNKFLCCTPSDSQYFSEILTEIQLQCLNPVCIYEYSPTKRELINITALIAKSPQSSLKQCSFLDDKVKLIEKHKKIVQAGIKHYNEWLKNTILIPPLSMIKKLSVRIKTINITHWAKFWERNTAVIELHEILQYLSERVINLPYVDDKRELIDSNGYIINRPNHDVTHSLRKLNYNYYIIKLISESSQNNWQLALKEFTQEELACMNFLIFLYRSGRTNELGSTADTYNVERSANIFELVTLQLGFNKQLIHTIKKCFNFIPIDAQLNAYFSEGYAGSSKIREKKAYLMHRIANISHDIDLVRCHSWRHYFQDEEAYLKTKAIDSSVKNFQFDILKQIQEFFPNLEKAKRITNNLFLLAKKSCEASGTPVHYEGFSSAEKVADYKDPIKDLSLLTLFKDKFDPHLSLVDIKSYWTEHVSQCLTLLNEVTLRVHEECCLDNLAINIYSNSARV